MKLKFALLFLLSSIGIYSQTVHVKYTEKRILSQENLASIPDFFKKEAIASHQYILEYNNGISLYKNSLGTTNVDKKETIIIEDQGYREETEHISANKRIEKWYYKDLNKNELLFSFYNTENFYGKDNLLNWDWKITNETKEILGFKCKKATSNAFGYLFIAWFTEDVAINAGPEKFDGLPGLILNLGTAYYEYAATEVQIEKDSIKIVKPAMPKETVTMTQIEDCSKAKISEFNSQPQTTNEIKGNSTITRIKISSKKQNVGGH